MEVVVRNDLTQLSRKTGERERKESTPDRHVKRCLNRIRAGPKPHQSLGSCRSKSSSATKAYQSLVCICSTELLRNKRWELKDDSSRLSTGREEHIWEEGRT